MSRRDGYEEAYSLNGMAAARLGTVFLGVVQTD